MALGATHYRVTEATRQAATEVVRRFGGSWNTYVGHGLPPARGEAYTVDFWAAAGRGYPLDEYRGDAMVAWILGQHVVKPVRILIWYSWIWLPSTGWKPYSGFQGNHGPGRDSHIHVGW